MSNSCISKILNPALMITSLGSILYSLTAFAQPTVTDNVISWNDEGWYQVQEAVTYETLCEGGYSCEVPNGSYIVINHSTGQRWTDVQVNVYPNQEADSGTDSPTRIDTESVASTPQSVGVDKIVEIDHVIYWPDNGWYEVQRAPGDVSLCQGGTFCDVSDDMQNRRYENYIVINHTTGTRTVLLLGPPNPLEDPWLLVVQAFEVLTSKAFDRRMRNSQPSIDQLVLVSSSQNGSTTINQYACSNGGTLERRTNVSGGYIADDREYDNCLLDHEIYNGSVFHIDNRQISERYRFENYSTRFFPDGEMTVNGGYFVCCRGPSRAGEKELYRVSTDRTKLDYFLTYPGGTLKVSDAEFTHYNSLYYHENTHAQVFNGSFIMEPPFSDQAFLVESTLSGAIAHKGNDNGVIIERGKLVITALSDGSEIIIEPDTGDISTFELTVDPAQWSRSYGEVSWSRLGSVLAPSEFLSD